MGLAVAAGVGMIGAGLAGYQLDGWLDRALRARRVPAPRLVIGLGCGLAMALILALEDESTAAQVRRVWAEAGIPGGSLGTGDGCSAA